MTNITLTKEDREELLQYINIMHETISKAGEIFDLDLSDLRNLNDLQWKLFHKLQLKHNDYDKTKWSEPFVLGVKE